MAVVGDTEVEADETLTVTIGTLVPLGRRAAADPEITDRTATGTITNDDTATVDPTRDGGARPHPGGRAVTPAPGARRARSRSRR